MSEITNHEQIVAAYETYLAENAKFTEKALKRLPHVPVKPCKK